LTLVVNFGLYSAFIGGYIYVFLGTVKEVSIGPTAVMSLLTYEFLHGHGIEHMVLLTFLAGCVELLMGILNLGFLIDFISTPVTSGFTSAYSIIIIASQLKYLFGLQKFKTKGFIDNVTKLLQHIHETKLWDTLLGIICILLLLALRKFKDIHVGSASKELTERQKKLKKAFWFISISRNAIVVLLSAYIAFLFESSGYSPFILSGKLDPGLPAFTLPAFSVQQGNSTVTFPEMCSELGAAIIIIPLVAVLANVAIAKAFSTGGSVDATQEMLTLGICNIFGSCFRSLPTCGAFTRSAVSNASGVRTPMMGLYSATLIVLALSLLTPYFYYIPRATLAAMLITAVVFMIDWEIFKPVWKTSKRDLFIVVLTFVSCLTVGVETGLLIGIAANLTFLIYMWARPSVHMSTNKISTGDQYIMVTPDIGLMYPAADYFSNIVFKAGISENGIFLPVVIDFEYMKGMDYTSVMTLKVLMSTLKERQQYLILYRVKPHIKQIFDNSDLKISCCETEEDIEKILTVGKVDFARSETLPLMENGSKEHRKSVKKTHVQEDSIYNENETYPLEPIININVDYQRHRSPSLE
ncbi:hypothetical protein L9F63_002588, partial [Diploptera punctata]